MKKWKVSPNEIPCEYVVEADSPEEAVEEAKAIFRDEADDLPWSVEEVSESVIVLKPDRG